MTVQAQTSGESSSSGAATGRTAILVAGMHRSGTSAFSGALSLLGVSVPGDLLPPHADNPKGYFESHEFVAFDDELLARLGSRWDDPFSVPSEPAGEPARQASVASLASLLKQTFGGRSPVLVKDPRICRLLPVWIEAVERVGYRAALLHPLRPAAEVAASLTKRDGISLSHGLALWLNHNLAAEHASRGRARSFVSYADLLEDGQAATARIGRELAVALPRTPQEARAELDDFLSKELRRQTSERSTLGGDDPLHRLCDRAWAALERLARDPADATAQASLDGIRAELRAAEGIAAALVADTRQQLANVEGQLRAAQAWGGDLERRLIAEIDAHRGRQAELDAVVRSTYWQAGQPLRAVAARLPEPLRRSARWLGGAAARLVGRLKPKA